MPRRESGPAAERRLFLARAPEHGRAELHSDDLDHALRVLRLTRGDAIFGLDGAGRSWKLRVGEVERRSVRLEDAELASEAPRPGSGAGAPPAITLYVALPKPGPAEEMFDRLVQLGLDRLVPLVTERSGPHARELSDGRRQRFERIAREAMKQSGRLWSPAIEPPVGLGTLLERGLEHKTAFLDPGSYTGFLSWSSEAIRAADRALLLVVGPEGGLTDAEVEALRAKGATGCLLARSILRIETAAEAALAVLAALDV